TGGWCVQAAMPAELPAMIRAWRKKLPADAPLIVAGGVACPSEALALIDSGASLLLVDAGMVFRGPGLVKRCNAALAGRCPSTGDARTPTSLFRRAWFWTVVLGVAMAAGGLATLLLAATRVLLPYDE